MFFESFKFNHLRQTKTNRNRGLRQICLLAIMISLLNTLQVLSSQANQYGPQKFEEGSRLSAKNVSLRPIINERDEAGEDGKARELFVLYRALFEKDRDKLSPRHRRTLPEANNLNESFERSYGRHVAPLRKLNKMKLDALPIQTYSEQTAPRQSDDERGALITAADRPGPLIGLVPQPESDDSVVVPAPDSQVSSDLGAFVPILSAGSGGLREAEYQPSLAELTAAGTAAGLVMSDLAAQADSSEDSPGFEEHSIDSPNSVGSELYKGLDKVIAKSSLPIRAQKLPEQPHREAQGDEDQQPAHESPDSMPESIESLMGVDGQEESTNPNEDDQQRQPQPQDVSASNQIQDESGDPLLIKSTLINEKQTSNDDDYGDNEDEDDDDDKKKKGQSTLIPASLPMMNRQQAFSGGEDGQLALMHNLPSELKAAAGHYKKKKVKKVKKKKIKKVKKKKIKKVKKVKIVKYKKKKKKKPKKKHHHHHDHGKYYMYAKVPKKKAWEFGFKKGNKKHWISRHEKGYKNKFKTKVKWYDKKSKGKGVHIWDYNHHDKKKKYG